MTARGARTLLAAAALSLSVGVAACGDSEATADNETMVDIADFKYMPETIEVSAGSTVTWTNSDTAPHTATADDSSFDTGDLDKGDSADVTFDEPGEFTYYCRFHAFMKATVEVQ
jgi:plastocyanin